MSNSLTVGAGRAASYESRRFDHIAPALLVPLLPVTTIGVSTIGIGAVLGLLMAPIGLQAVLRYIGIKRIVALWLICLFTGPILAVITADEISRSLNERLGIRLVLLFLNAGVSLYILLWSRAAIGARITAVLYALGLIAEAVLSQLAFTSPNPWKYLFAFPVAIILLTLARSRPQAVIILLLIAAISVFDDSRSFTAMTIMALIAILVTPKTSGFSRGVRLRAILVIGLSTVGVYFLLSEAFLRGWLGKRLQEVAIRQTRGGEVSLLVGGRPEWGAAVELFWARPIGFGPGVIPNTVDVHSGVTGLVALGVNQDHPYVREYLFNNRLEVHSVTGDLWLLFGLAGLALACVIVWFLVAGLMRGSNQADLGAVGVLVGFIALWDMAFSPIANIRNVVLALALLMSLRPKESGVKPQAGEHVAFLPTRS